MGPGSWLSPVVGTAEPLAPLPSPLVGEGGEPQCGEPGEGCFAELLNEERTPGTPLATYHPLPQGERVTPAHSNYGLICPVPRMRYLNVVSCSKPTGPRACMRPVAMPISAPKPNSPPSANCVEALCSTIALSTSVRNLCAAFSSAVTIASV